MSHAPRVLLGFIAVVTLALTAGGAFGLWATGAPASRWDAPGAAVEPAAAHVPARDMEGANGAVADGSGSVDDQEDLAPTGDDDVESSEGSGTSAGSEGSEGSDGSVESRDSDGTDPTASTARPEPALPAGSGSGRRVVFDTSEQRVWLVEDGNRVRRTYLVSGSVHDNLSPGGYDVYSRSLEAVSYTYEETMRFMVRFAHGEQAAIGFHDIPQDQRGRPVQSRAQLGTPLSSGCIRQARPDALALWRFADLGTRVVVVA